MAEGSDVFPRVERMHLYLVHSREDPRLRLQELLQLIKASVNCLRGQRMHIIESSRSHSVTRLVELRSGEFPVIRRKATCHCPGLANHGRNHPS